MENLNTKNDKSTIGMYLDPKIAEIFAQKEKNDAEEHSVVSKTIDDITLELFNNKNRSIKIANLGAGANPQKYKKILEKLKEGWVLDWVDISPKMLEIASKEVNYSEEINFIKNDFTGYLNSQEDHTLDCVIIQYAINYIDNLVDFFQVLSKKLNKEGAFIANLGAKVLENNQWASFLINGQEFTGKKSLSNGDRYTIRFLNPDGTVSSSTEKNFFSDKEIISTSKKFGLTAEINMINGVEMLVVKNN